VSAEASSAPIEALWHKASVGNCTIDQPRSWGCVTGTLESSLEVVCSTCSPRSNVAHLLQMLAWQCRELSRAVVYINGNLLRIWCKSRIMRWKLCMLSIKIAWFLCSRNCISVLSLCTVIFIWISNTGRKKHCHRSKFPVSVL